jgi:EAL domain-containing protein (putative c-di-GMP-specific phosphodiesterase class I)
MHRWIAWTLSGLIICAAALLLPEPRQLGALAGLAVTAAGLTMLVERRDAARTRATQPDGDRRGPDEAAVRSILQADAITMHFQPIVWLPTREIVGYEALARFPVPPPRPDQWFELAARCGLRVELELAAVRKALAALPVTPADTYVSLNVSPETLLSDELPVLLEGCPGERIVLELTEHLPIADYDAHLPRLELFRAEGIRLAVDDAGAGYSSLRHILILRPEIIKLDRTLTTGAAGDAIRKALLTSLATFAHATKTTLIAEGVETTEELAALIEYGVAFGQGYLFQRPAPLGELLVDRA